MGQVWQATDTQLNRQVPLRRPGRRAPCWSFVAVACVSVLPIGCANPGSDALVLTADLPLHLEDHLDAATIEGSEIPTDVPEAVEWVFDEPQPDWRPAYGYEFSQELVTLVRTGDALRVVIEEEPHRDEHQESKQDAGVFAHKRHEGGRQPVGSEPHDTEP